MYRIYFFIGLILFLYLTSCLDDVAHDNPIDPDNKNQGLQLKGKVQTLYAPVAPIPNAVLSIQQLNKNIFSAPDGTFEFNNLEPGNYVILCSAPGYNTDSIEINLGSHSNINFNLDGLPYFERISLSTHHITRFFPVDDFFNITLEAKVNDTDGVSDIHKVFFEIPEFSASDTLPASLIAGEFRMTLSVSDLPVNTIHSLIGRAFFLSVMDDAGIIVKSGEQFLTRIIDETPIVTFPQNLTTVVADTINFEWQVVRLPFWFTHTIEIYQINFGLLSFVTEINNIGATETSYIFANNLPNGDYVWILIVEDEFGNTSSSKEGTFNVSK
ncbi:MAG: carboxypeptidase regulatory-like domain-containing protein [Calditrichaeota bacterium]|nr:carboxypeptidase regulatory-like domain-containing protein [Calditrichota bacterium]